MRSIKRVAVAKSLAIFCICCAIVALITNCNSKKIPSDQSPAAELKKYTYTQPHLGTTVHLVFYSDNDELAASLAQQCFQYIRELNSIFSDYIDDSELNQLCNKPLNQAHKVSEPLFTVIARAQEISAKSNGAFDITIGTQTKRWRQRQSEFLPSPSTSSHVSYRDLKLDPLQQSITLLAPLQLDLGGIAKGYIADQLMHRIKAAGLSHAAVIIGGETVLAAAPPGKDGWRIGLEDPERKIIGSLILENTCLSTSGDSYQFIEQDGQRQAHLIDPTTRKPMSNRLNVTTIAPSAMEADAWATALRILPLEKSLPLANQQPHLQALFMPYQQPPSKTDHFPTINH